jgi:predicted heme/steroid binding protein
MTRNIVLATFASVILGLAMIGGAVYWQLQPANAGGAASKTAASSAGEPSDRSYTLEELAEHDGKEGTDCLVAVDGDVYLIEGFALWQMGEHLPSGGRARCGLDLTEVIDESPHGRSKLNLLRKAGNLVQSPEAA